MDPGVQDRLQFRLEELLDVAVTDGVPASEFREWLLKEAEYQIRSRVDGGEWSVYGEEGA